MSIAPLTQYVYPEKSLSDNRNYKIFKLENELQILVVSDETTEKVFTLSCFVAKILFGLG